MAMNYISRTLSVIVMPETEPVYSEMATRITIEDEAGGEFVEVSQEGRLSLGKIAIDPAEWPTLRAAIDDMIAQCRARSDGDE
jgi:DNA-binding protein YbaB